MEKFLAQFESSRERGRGVTLYFQSQTISLVVREIHDTNSLEGYNQEFETVVVKLDGLIAVGSN